MSTLSEEPQAVLMLGPATSTVRPYVPFQKLFLPLKGWYIQGENGLFLLPSRHLNL